MCWEVEYLDTNRRKKLKSVLLGLNIAIKFGMLNYVPLMLFKIGRTE
jgi:hypothetical protein